MKVIIADRGYRNKAVGLLEDSEDEVKWMNDHLNELQNGCFGPRIQQFRVYEFDENNKPVGIGGAMIYAVNMDDTWYGKVSATP